MINSGSRFNNVYEDAERAESYAKLDYPGTYYLAFRDIPGLLEKHVSGKTALDFGCGAGRSTRFLKNLGFEAVGADISANMIKIAKESDPETRYVLLSSDSFDMFEDTTFDLVFSAFTFDNIPTWEKKTAIFRDMRRILKQDGRIINLVSSPEIYLNEWVSFTTKDYPENREAKTGDKVRIVMTDVPDRRPVEDIVWMESDYHELYHRSGLEITETHKPLGRPEEPIDWVSEMQIAPWTIYVLK